MLREEAKMILEEVKIMDDSMYQYNTKYLEALDMAIEALNQLTSYEQTINKLTKAISEQEPCEDAISRQEVLNQIFYSTDNSGDVVLGSVLRRRIENLTSVKPQKLCTNCQVEEKTGHWFVDERPESDREIICSNCEQPIFKYHKLDFDYRPNYCPNCGARMESAEC